MGIEVHVDVIGIVVSDMAEALAFYRRLGVETPAASDTEPHVEVALPGGMRLAFDTEAMIRSFHPGWAPSSGAPRISLAFAAPTAADVDALYAELTADGSHGELAPFDAPWGQRYAVLHDPDGNGVDLFAPLAS